MFQTICKVQENAIIVRPDFKALVITKLEGYKALLVLSRVFGQKSRRQLGFYWAGVCKEAADYFGYAGGKEEMNRVLEKNCNPVEAVNQKTGEVTIYGGSSKDMDKEEYSSYISRCIIFLAEWGFTVKTPEEYYNSIDIQDSHRTEQLL
jgi:hypothetical protein